MNYHEKFGASSLKIDRVMLNSVFGGHFFWRPFCFLVTILFLDKKMWSAIVNYHAKSGASSLKIDRVMALSWFCPKFRLMTYCLLLLFIDICISWLRLLINQSRSKNPNLNNWDTSEYCRWFHIPCDAFIPKYIFTGKSLTTRKKYRH